MLDLHHRIKACQRFHSSKLPSILPALRRWRLVWRTLVQWIVAPILLAFFHDDNDDTMLNSILVPRKHTMTVTTSFLYIAYHIIPSFIFHNFSTNEIHIGRARTATKSQHKGVRVVSFSFFFLAILGIAGGEIIGYGYRSLLYFALHTLLLC